jgi:hypothetical protein
MSMSRHSAKSAGRSAKTAGRPTEKAVKKAGKSARGSSSAASKSARRSTVKSARAAPAAIVRAPSVAPKPVRIIRTHSPPVQPSAPSDLPMHAHRYRVGETVYYTSPTFGRAAATGYYTVVKLLPSEGDDYQYRIKSSGEAFERVAKESQLDRA